MKEIPILFSTAMVQAILEGRKSQTRRIMKPKIKDCDHSRHIEADWKDKPIQWSETALKIGRAYCGCCGNGVEYSNDFGGIKCPFGKPGDLLWVRENWRLKGWDFEEGTMLVEYATGEKKNCLAYDPTEDSEWLMNYVDKLEKEGYIIATSSERFEFTSKKQPFKPSIHMPKEAARIWLQVTDVRVERLQDISEADAIAEGIEQVGICPSDIQPEYKDYCGELKRIGETKEWGLSPIGSFQSLWVKINGAESWQANPWVRVVSFKVLSTTGKPAEKSPITNI